MGGPRGHREGTLACVRRSNKLLGHVLLPFHHVIGAFAPSEPLWMHLGNKPADVERHVCSEYCRGVDACVWPPRCVSSCLHSSA